ncbi:MAG: HD domain-containing protein [Proteobacteria bacterium]|nr:HD domain-containing protein [Pseudomonadota bacterium]
MHIPLYRRLWFEILYKISIVIGIIILASFFYIINYQKRELIKYEKDMVTKLSTSLEKSLYYGMERNDFTIVENVISDVIKDQRDIKSIYILNKPGKILISSEKTNKGSSIPINSELCVSCHNGTTPKREKFAIIENADSFRVVNLLFNGPTCLTHHSSSKKVLGALVIEISKENINGLLRRNLEKMIYSSLITFAILIILTFLVITLFVTCPIKDLMKAMIDASKGNLNVEVKIPSGNEIGILAKTFNFMVNKLKEFHENDLKKEHEIAKMQEKLRYKAELETLNAQLKARVLELENANNQIEMMVKDIEEKNFHLEKAVDRLKILYRISRCLTTVLNPDDVIKMIVEKSVQIMKAKTGSLMLINDTKDSLYIKYAIGMDENIIKNTLVKVGDSVAGWVAKEAKPLIVKNIETDERFKKISKDKYETRSLISSPGIIKGEVLGVLNVNNKLDGSEFTEDELELLNTLAGQTAVSLENAKLYTDLQKSYFDTIRALVNAIEAKDKYTRGHSERVTCYALEIGKRLNLTPKRMEILQHAAILHDIGKIGTDLNILNKSGFLTIEEFEVVKEHPLVGSQILDPISFLEDVKSIIAEHHERYDGKGYPLGKKGEEISLESRIIAICDAFDAMTSDRPYRKALNLETALEEIKRCAGTQFDPQLVDIFALIIEENPSCMYL